MLIADLPRLNTTHATAETQAVFPGRIDLIVGDSSETVPKHAASEIAAGQDPRVCNVVFVDGNHSEDGTYADLVNFQALASRSGRSYILCTANYNG